MTNTASSVIITVENPNSTDAIKLITELTNEIILIYGDDGSAGFTPEDVLVPGGAFVIAWVNNRPIGCGAIRPFIEPGVGEIKRMYVVKDFRGNHIARRILERLEEIARLFGYRTLKLETGYLQPSAIHLYESVGFIRIPCYLPYNDESSLCFEKRLDF